MSIVIADRVKETTTTTGTGTVNLAGAVTGYRTFVAGAGDGGEVCYVIEGRAGGAAEGEWEIGVGTVTDASPDTLSRGTVLESSNAGAAVNFSAGTKDVFLALPTARLAESVLPILHVRDQKATTTEGGGSSAGTWNVRTLNTVVTNQIAGASLATNQITLPAGTYRVRATAPAYGVNRHKARLRNVTDGTTTLVGLSQFNGTLEKDSQGRSEINGRFTIAAEKDFELQHYTENAVATLGLGVGTDDGEVEVYAEVWIERER